MSEKIPYQAQDLGLREYQEAHALQQELVRAKRQGFLQEDVIIFVEHPPVITLGRSTRLEHLLTSRERLEKLGIKVLEVDRGGDVTYHGPGQLVSYLIVDLKRQKCDVHWMLRQLEEGIIRTLKDFGLCSERIKGMTGVWVEGKKIASIGIGVRGWVTYHGLTINVNNSLEPFQYIIPCGLKGKVPCSLKEILRGEVNMAIVKGRLLCHFQELFQWQIASPSALPLTSPFVSLSFPFYPL